MAEWFPGDALPSLYKVGAWQQWAAGQQPGAGGKLGHTSEQGVSRNLLDCPSSLLHCVS